MGTTKTRKHLHVVTPSAIVAPVAPGQLPALDRVVSEAQAAEIIGYSKDTLRREFRAGRAPERVRLSGRRIGYRLSALYAFLEANTEKPWGTAMSRQRLQNCRPCETFSFECNGQAYSATIGRFGDGPLAEIFLGDAKAGSHSDSAAKDSAVVASLALLHGVTLETIRKALLRDSQGRAAALDCVAAADWRGKAGAPWQIGRSLKAN
jgi:hypothetical protein